MNPLPNNTIDSTNSNPLLNANLSLSDNKKNSDKHRSKRPVYPVSDSKPISFSNSKDDEVIDLDDSQMSQGDDAQPLQPGLLNKIDLERLIKMGVKSEAKLNPVLPSLDLNAKLLECTNANRE